MFYEEPKVIVSGRVAVFMYGNGVSVMDATLLYKASQTAWSNVSKTHMYGLYKQWDKHFPSTLFHYDMKKWVMRLGRFELVEPEISVR